MYRSEAATSWPSARLRFAPGKGPEKLSGPGYVPQPSQGEEDASTTQSAIAAGALEMRSGQTSDISRTPVAHEALKNNPRSGSWTRPSVRLPSCLARRDEALQRGATTPGGLAGAQSGA
jgi:hypothetical protein